MWHDLSDAQFLNFNSGSTNWAEFILVPKEGTVWYINFNYSVSSLCLFFSKVILIQHFPAFILASPEISTSSQISWCVYIILMFSVFHKTFVHTFSIVFFLTFLFFNICILENNALNYWSYLQTNMLILSITLFFLLSWDFFCFLCFIMDFLGMYNFWWLIRYILYFVSSGSYFISSK